MKWLTVMHVRRAALPAAAVALAGVLAGCGAGGPWGDGGGPWGDGGGGAAPTAGTEVSVVDDAFEPRHLQVEAGETVTWTWDGGRDHNVVGDGFESDVQRAGAFVHTFARPGTYDYRCTLHGGMSGSVTVLEQ